MRNGSMLMALAMGAVALGGCGGLLGRGGGSSPDYQITTTGV